MCDVRQVQFALLLHYVDDLVLSFGGDYVMILDGDLRFANADARGDCEGACALVRDKAAVGSFSGAKKSNQGVIIKCKMLTT